MSKILKCEMVPVVSVVQIGHGCCCFCTIVDLVSLVSVGISVRCFDDCSVLAVFLWDALVIIVPSWCFWCLLPVGVPVKCRSACSIIQWFCWCFCRYSALVTVMSVVSLVL